MVLSPYSIAVVPPEAPPPILGNPKKKLVLDLQLADLLAAVTVGAIRAAIEDQTGEAPGFFVLTHVHAWGPTAPSSDSQVLLQDLVFGTQSRGDSTTTLRARAGFAVPRNVQHTYRPADASVGLFQVTLTPHVVTQFFICRVGVVYWGLGD